VAYTGPSAETLTIMMTDVEGSTALRRIRGDRLADEILGLHGAIVRVQVGRCGGQERQFLGDGFLLSFPSPVAAIRCAVGIQTALAEHNASDAQREARVRIGIHVGEVSERDGQLYGQAVHVAARITAEAAGGQILVSDVVRQQAEPEGTWRFVDSGLFWLKGFDERWRLFEVSLGEAAPLQRPSIVAPRLTPLIGRDSEQADLRRAVDEALAGHGGLAVVAGEAGVGKSRLVAEIGGEAEARGMRVLTGHCVEMDSVPPYLPYVEMIEQVISSPRSPLALREALGDVAPEIARIAPALRRLFPDIAQPLELPPELARRYLWNSFAEFVARGAQTQPLLLVLEDLHWADDYSLLLTEYLAPLLPEMPVRIIGTYRDDEIDISHPLSHVISQLGRRRLIDRISLRRLSFGDVRAMVEALVGQPPPERLVRIVDSETEGNPFFVEELYLHLAESGVLSDERGRIRADLKVDEASVPESIRLVVGERLSRLSRYTREALVAAAVSGRVFAPDFVGEVAGVDMDTLIDAFEEAEQARLIAPVKGDGNLVFSHELIRQTLLADVSTLKRERLHVRAANAIERRYADDIEEHAADLTHHLSRAGRSADRPRLVRYLTIAGERAADAAAFDDAVAHFDQALSLVERGNRDTRAELLERLAMALRSVGRWDDALRAMNEALDLYQALGRTDALGRLSWAMVSQLTWTARIREAVQAAQRALAALGDIASADRARLLSAMGWAVSLGGDHAMAKQMFDQARSLADQVGNERALADVLHMQTIHHFGYAEFIDGVSVGLRAAEVFEREGALWDLCSVQAFVIYQDGAVGSREQAIRLADKTMAIARRLGHLGATFMLLLYRAREAVTLADLESLETLGPQMVDVCERGSLPWLYVGHLCLGLAAHWRGDAERAEAEFRRAVELEPAGAYSGSSTSILVRHLAHSGHAEEVLAIYQSARPTLPSPDQVNSNGMWSRLFGLVEALYLCGFSDDAAALSPLVEKALERGPDWISFDGRLVRTRAGMAAAAGGSWEAAERHFAVAQQHAKRIRNRLEETDLHRLRARMLLDRDGPGDGARAAKLLEKALDDYRKFAMPSYAAETERMLRVTAEG
jgi:class 3 adenylate cyclase/tetratricopeptide (TPR) repeat protein